MRTGYTTVQNFIQQTHSLNWNQTVVAEWNLNRYASYARVWDAGYDDITEFVNYDIPAMFPIESIVRPFRWSGRAMYASDFTMKIQRGLLKSDSVRHYIPSTDNEYQYYLSPGKSINVGGSYGYVYPTPDPDINPSTNPGVYYYGVKPTVLYYTDSSLSKAEYHRCNKIVVQFSRNSTPTLWNITVYTDDGDEQITGLTNNTINTLATTNHPDRIQRQVELWRDVNGNWSIDPNYWSPTNQNTVPVRGIRVRMENAPAAGERVGIVEVSPRLECDLSSYVQGFSTEASSSEQDHMSPVGTMSTDTGSIELDNSTGLFLAGESSSGACPWANKLDDGIMFRIWARVRAATSTGAYESVKIATMLSDSWTADSFESASVTLVDFSKILQARHAPDTFLKNKRISDIIIMLLDRVGFSRIDTSNLTMQDNDIVEYFWCKKEDTVWEVIKNLARAYQCVVYFTPDGYLKIMTRSSLFDRKKSPVWTFRAKAYSPYIPDVYECTRTRDYGFNNVSITYHPTSEYLNTGNPAINAYGQNYWPNVKALWQPEGVDVCTAATLARSLAVGGRFMYLNMRKPAGRPLAVPLSGFSGILETDGYEFPYSAIQYILEGKYNNGRKEIWIGSEKDWQYALELNNGIPPQQTSPVCVRLKKPSPVALQAGKSKKGFQFIVKQTGNNGFYDGTPWWSVDNDHGCWTLNNHSTAPKKMMLGWKKYPRMFNSVVARMRITGSVQKSSRAGITMMTQSSKSSPKGPAYYAFTLTIDDSKATSTTEAIVTAERYNMNGTITALPESNATKGDILGDQLRTNQWAWLEVVLAGSYRSGYEFYVCLDGNLIGKFEDKSSARLPYIQTAGLVAGPKTVLQADKLITSYFPGGRNGGRGYTYWPWTYFRGNQKSKLLNPRVSPGDLAYQYYFRLIKRGHGKVYYTDLSDTVKEYKKFSVRFSDGPALTCNDVLSNFNLSIEGLTWTAFGATFYVRNMSDYTQPLNGALPHESGQEEQFLLMLSGRSIFTGEAREYKKEIRNIENRRGEIAITFDSQWIQSEQSASGLANWITENFSGGMQTYSIDSAGNPLLEIGDIVLMYYPDKNFDYGNTKRMVITGVRHTYDGGLDTTFSAIRVPDTIWE